LGYARVELEPGHAVEVAFDVPTQRLAFSDRRMVRVVEPGTVHLFVGADCADRELRGCVELTGPVHEVTASDRRLTRARIGEPVRVPRG
jgi:hypothetical protein